MADFPKGIDARQILARAVLQQLFPNLGGQQLDVLLDSIDQDLTVPLRADASSTPDLVVTLGASVVSNSISGRTRSIPHITNQIVTFTGGTVTFPSADGGTITPSPGAALNLTCPINNYVKVLISLDSSANLVVTVGTANTVELDAPVPSPVSDTLAICYVTLFNNAGVIAPIVQDKIYQLTGGGGGGGGAPQAGFAQEVSVPVGNTSLTVTFPSALPGVSYVPLAQLANYVDGTPQYQEVTITAKTTGGFTASWNAPTDSSDYKLVYIVPTVQTQNGEFAVPFDTNSITIPLPITLTSNMYVVVAQLVNYVDGIVQFQPAMPTAKTSSDFTVSWNANTDSASYKVAYQLAFIQ